MTTNPIEPTPTPAPKPRIFIFDNREHEDPNPEASLEDIRGIFADFNPELYNAEMKQYEKDGKVYIQLIKKVGVKGSIYSF